MSFPEAERAARLEVLPTEVISPYCWGFWARPKQLVPDGQWRVWLILSGRGWGKSRMGSETVRRVARSGRVERIALVGDSAADVRDVMVEGPDGILRRSRKEERPRYEPSKRRLTWPNGCVATTFSADEPDQLRGPQHGFAWVDELAKFRYAQETWDNLMFGLRMGENPRVVVTTTPRPISLLRALIKREGKDVVVTRGTTYENERNLPGAFLTEILAKYEGTTVGRQELMAEMLDETPGSLWIRKALDALKVESMPELRRVAVGVDPSVSEDGSGAECGIVVVGVDGRDPAHGYVLEDATVRGGPGEWARKVSEVYERHGANLVVAEGNQGGALVRQVLQSVNRRMPVVTVYASRGKVARAEPVAMLYEQGRMHHAGSFPLLEDEMVNWLPGMASPNRIDALVWGLTELMVKGGGEVGGEVF